jgi:hypothetical protein
MKESYIIFSISNFYLLRERFHMCEFKTTLTASRRLCHNAGYWALSCQCTSAVSAWGGFNVEGTLIA